MHTDLYTVSCFMLRVKCERKMESRYVKIMNARLNIKSNNVEN